MYFIIKVFKGTVTHYQKIENPSMVIVVVVRHLWLYLHGHKILEKTNYPIRQVLKKLKLTGRMVSWAMELSENDI